MLQPYAAHPKHTIILYIYFKALCIDLDSFLNVIFTHFYTISPIYAPEWYKEAVSRCTLNCLYLS
ncbi:hypothetical protein BDQ17DRAFT_921466 [Cyathus striatus]|nr:hypothetical protein BDQ17DRAFT_921466 [Cyathus striatus]